ncbi:MAG: V-type ATPase subunit [Candidatus Ornithomonoglobus sp.]
MKDYTYSVARIRAKEASLLSKQDIEQLISAADHDEAVRLLRDKNGIASEEELRQLLGELADEETIRVLRLPVDYHNIKAAVKAVFSDTDAGELLLDNGTEDKNVIYEAVRTRDYDKLDNELADTAERAMKLLLHTQDGQLCDLLIDKAQLAAVERAARQTGDSFIMRYAGLTADLANLRTALRCALTDRSRSFIENALYDGGSLNYNLLASAAEGGTEKLFEYVSGTAYSDGARYMKSGAAVFEKWCDDRIMELMDTAKYDSFSAAPIIAYAYAKETEQKAVRLILSAKKSGFDNDIIRERVRRLYV